MKQITTESLISVNEIIEQFICRCQELEIALKERLAQSTSAEVSLKIEIILQKLALLRQNLQPSDTLYSIILCGEDYVSFCNLIVCGSSMAEYLLSLSRSSELAKNHAQFWQKLVVAFKPYLESALIFWNN